MKNALFVTGTDTGVGKTLVAGALASWAHARGIRAAVLKPVETGVAAGDEAEGTTDAALLARAAGGIQRPEEVCLYSFREPVAPSLAARLENRKISIPHIRKAIVQAAGRYPVLIIEGAGGPSVPIAGRTTMADLAQELEIPVLLVAANRLGAINHTVLSIDYLRQRKIGIRGVLFNRTSPDGGIAEETNPGMVRTLRPGLPYIGSLPYLDNRAERHACVDWISAVPASRLRRLLGV